MRRWKAARTDAGAPGREAADVLDRLGGCLQQHACSVDPRIGKPGHRATPVSSRNRRVSVRRDMCARPTERVEVESGRRVLQHPVAKRPELIADDLGAQPFDELRLSSLTLWQRGQDPCRRVGRGGAVVASDEVGTDQCRSSCPRRSEDVAVVDEQTVGQHLDQGVATL